MKRHEMKLRIIRVLDDSLSLTNLNQLKFFTSNQITQPLLYTKLAKLGFLIDSKFIRSQ